MHFCILHRNSRCRLKLRESDSCEKSPVGSAYALQIQNFVEIALSHTISKINVLLHFTQNFKMASKSGGKAIFVKSRQYTLGVENFDEIPLSRMVKEIEANLCLSIFGENSKWPLFLGRGISFENWQE